ncbi:YybS family protein [Staphylococcus pasteuri]|uniref:YybS family protein n=1 Tax=Staphylococcus pasteuri TaxID=45972 RepID=UPI0032618B7F
MGVACVFSKIQPKATILGTLVLAIVALVTHVLPILGLILCLFATIPGVVLWNKSIQSFGISALVTVIITTLLGNTFVLSIMVLVILTSLIIGQLLKERATKERILYVTTVSLSLMTLIGFMLLQVFEKIPRATALVNPVKETVHNVLLTSGANADYRQMLEESIRKMTVQLPSYLIIIVFLIVLINLIITFPILRKFKVGTPIFKPLFAWQMNRTLLTIYIIDLICVMFATQPNTFQSIVLNFEVVLSLVMYIQGISVIHFFGKAKRLPNVVTVILMILGTLLTPMTHIVGLIGVIDLCINLKQLMNNNNNKK